jgi:hypothetical protein
MSITLNPDQTLASAKIHDFLKDPFTKGGVFTPEGLEQVKHLCSEIY